MENMKVYNDIREVPDNAKKAIQGGRLKGKTDINPMWRIKTLTEQFGPCGFGWKTEITNRWLEQGVHDTQAAFVEINLFIKVGDQWSEAIPGIGGSMFVADEKDGPYTSDECFKMAYTDAISVACKALGMGADVYWNQDSTKYCSEKQNPYIPQKMLERLTELGGTLEKVAAYYKKQTNEVNAYEVEAMIEAKEKALAKKTEAKND